MRDRPGDPPGVTPILAPGRRGPRPARHRTLGVRQKWHSRRRPTGVLLAGVALAIGAAGLLGGDRRPSPEHPLTALSRRLDAATEPARFAFTYRRGGTRVLDCMLPNTGYSAEVDTSTARMGVRTGGPSAPMTVVVAGDEIFLHRSLVANPPFPTVWLRATRRPAGGPAAVLRRVLGADLALDVAGDRLPPSGHAVAAEALAVAASVERLGSATVAGALAERYRIFVDRSRYREAAAAPRASSGSEDELVPVFEVWFDERGDVVKVVVSGRKADGASASPEEGWTVEYRRLAAPAIAVPTPTDVADLAAFDGAEFAPAPKECRLPS